MDVNFMPALERNGTDAATDELPFMICLFINSTRGSFGWLSRSTGTFEVRYTFGCWAANICLAMLWAVSAFCKVMQSRVWALGIPVDGKLYRVCGGNLGVDWTSQNPVLLPRSNASTPFVCPRVPFVLPVMGFSSL